MIESPKAEPTVEDVKGERWKKRKASLEQMAQSFGPGFQPAAPRFAAPEEPMQRSARETINATLRQGVTGSLLFGFEFDQNIQGDPEYDVTQDMRPQDYAYAAQFARSPNTSETNRLQAEIDNRTANYNAMQARPWASAFASFLDPISLGLDLATFGTANIVTIPLMANTLRRTVAGARILNTFRRMPRAEAVLSEALKGGQAGASSIYLQEKIKSNADILQDEEDIGTHVFFGTLIGTALGGSVGLIGSKSTDKIRRQFIEGNNVTQNASQAPEPVGPTTPRDLGLRAEMAPEPPKRTPEQIKTDADALRFESGEGGAPKRQAEYEQMRSQYKVIGEDFVKNLNVPDWLKKPLSLVSAPIRNMSATNRLLSKPFGTARLFAIGMARNATEFLGTREGLILPKSAQNRIEQITDSALNANLDVYQLYMRANGIEPGKFASERLAYGKRAYDETEFFNDVGTQLLHVGKPTETTRGVNPFVQQAAKLMYENIYKPFGDLLMEYKLIKPDADIAKELNYLNRLWSTDKLLANPEGFKNWLADYFKKQNQKLRSIRPFYDQKLKDARNLRTLSKRFEKNADLIDKLKNKIEKDQDFAGKIESLNREKESFIENTREKYDEKRDEISQKYAKKRSVQDTKSPDITSTKKILRSELSDAIKERDALTQEYETERVRLTKELKDFRSSFSDKKRDILKGAKDKEIFDAVKKADVEALLESPEYRSLTVEEIEAFSDAAIRDLDEASLRELRNDYLALERIKALEEIDAVKLELALLRDEKKQILAINKGELTKRINEAQSLLSEVAVMVGKLSKEKRIEKLVDKNEKLELKVVDLKEAKEIAVYEKDVVHKIAKINEPVSKLEMLQRKYSREGFKLYAERKGIERLRPIYEMQGMSEAEIQDVIKAAKRKERKALKEVPIENEARIMADELMEASMKVNEEAEALIPDDLRSNETGRPRRIFDDELEPDYAYNQAEKTFYTMLGQDDEMVVNPVLMALGGGQSSIFKPRAIKMPDNYPGIEQWVERDIRFLSDNFARGIAPAIALTELMHDLNKLPIVQQTVKRMQVANKRIGAERALDMPSTMQHFSEVPAVIGTMMREEYRMMAQGLKGEALEKLTRDYQSAEKDMATLDKIIRGVFGNGANVNAKNFSDVVDLVNSAASTVTTNNIVISMLSDLMAPATRYGLKNYITKGLLPLLSSAELRGLAESEMKMMDIALKTAQGSIIKNRVSGRPGSLKNSWLGKKITNFSNRIGNITFANQMQTLMETATAVLIKTAFLEMAERAAIGKLTKKELTHLAQRGVGVEDIQRVYELWKSRGFSKGPTRGIDPNALINISPQEAKAFSIYQRFINDDLRTIIVRPGAGSLPDWAYSSGGKAVLFLKKYFFAATNDLLLPAAQRADAESLQGFAGMFAIGALQSKLRALYRGQDDQEFNLEGFVSEALTNSALLGIYTFGLDASLTAGLIAGMGGARYDPSNGLPSLLLGPGIVGYSDKTLNILGKMRRIMTDEDKQFTYRDFNYIANTAIPLYKWAPISSILKPNVKEYFESIGRGE